MEKIAAHFDIKYTRYLDPSGKPVQTLPKEIDKATLTALYRALLRTRTFDAKAGSAATHRPARNLRILARPRSRFGRRGKRDGR